MLSRTPVVPTLPAFVLRNVRPPRTPLIKGHRVRSVKYLLTASDITPGELDAAVEMAGFSPESDPAWAGARDDLLRTSCAYFASETIRGPKKAPYKGRFLLGRHHLEWDELIQEFDRMCILAARDHGKSFFFSLAYPIWKAGYNMPGSLGYIFSSTQPESEKFLAMVKEELLENPLLAHLIPYTGDRFWSARQIRLRNGSVIRCRGFGVKVRGGHPDWMVGDDMLDDDDIYSETIRRKNIDYFLSALSNMVPMGDGKRRGGQLIVVGTPMHQADLYSSLRKGGQYAYREYPCRDKAGALLFPERYNEVALANKRAELQSEARFAREFMCQPLTDEASLFPSKLFEGPEVRLPYVLGQPASYWDKLGMPRFTGVDIAMSAETGGDYFVIFTLAKDTMGNRWLANIVRVKGWGFQRQIDAIKDEYYNMRPDLIHIEANQMQRVWSDEIIRTTDIPVRKFFTTGIGGRQPLTPWVKGATSISVNKHHIDRGVPGMRMTLENGKWRIPRGDEYSIEMTDNWIGEMGSMGWLDGKVQSVGEHDDLVMACWMAHTAADRGAARMEMMGTADVIGTPELSASPRIRPPELTVSTGEPDLAGAARDVGANEAKRLAISSVQAGRAVDCGREHYREHVRNSLQQYAGQCVDGGDHARAVIALNEVKRLDALHKVRVGDL